MQAQMRWIHLASYTSTQWIPSPVLVMVKPSADPPPPTAVLPWRASASMSRPRLACGIVLMLLNDLVCAATCRRPPPHDIHSKWLLPQKMAASSTAPLDSHHFALLACLLHKMSSDLLHVAVGSFLSTPSG